MIAIVLKELKINTKSILKGKYKIFHLTKTKMSSDIDYDESIEEEQLSENGEEYEENEVYSFALLRRPSNSFILTNVFENT